MATTFLSGILGLGVKLRITCVGGALPGWVQLDCDSDNEAVAEFVIVRAHSSDLSSARDFFANEKDSADRVLIVDRDVASKLPLCNLAVSGASEDLDFIAEALARVASGVVFIGTCLNDVYEVARGAGEISRMGRAAVVRNALTKESLQEVELRLSELDSEGFDGGVVWFHLIAEGDDALDILKIDEAATALFVGPDSKPCVLSGALNASATAMVLIAFPH